MKRRKHLKGTRIERRKLRNSLRVDILQARAMESMANRGHSKLTKKKEVMEFTKEKLK
jgi:hypothetical protein